jgi:hypothetical protein
MVYDEEIQARKLYETLTHEILEPVDGSEISIEGIGAHWHCLATLNDRECRIDCMGSSGYAVSFNSHGATDANGRTKSEDQVISATISWLQNGNLEEMYRLFEFVDYKKRSLSKVIETFTNQHPECIQKIKINLNQNFAGNFDLELEAKDRSCKVYLWGEDKKPTYDFYWDDCMLFSCTERDRETLMLMKLWLYNYYMPSQLEQAFSWLDTGKLAKYYEEGRGIEGEFILSWDQVEEFYGRRLSFILNPDDILKLITQLREKGYDKTLRAGHAMPTLIVSRARRHGFMTQFIAFDFFNNGMKVTAKFDSEKKLSFPNIELTPEVEELIKQLEAKDLELAPEFWR